MQLCVIIIPYKIETKLVENSNKNTVSALLISTISTDLEF